MAVMSAWSAFYRRLATAVDVGHTVAPADIIPGFLTLDDTPAAVEIEHGARVAEALRLVEAALARESQRSQKTGVRNPDLANLCLEIRSALRPSAPGSEVLREVPPVDIRYAAPVVPRGAA